jgi:hypothetical protein
MVKSIADDWLGSLYSNVLNPKDCLKFWDYVLLYGSPLLFQYVILNFYVIRRFGVSILDKFNPKLETLIKKERKVFQDLGVQDPQGGFLLCVPTLKKILTSVISTTDFQHYLSYTLKALQSVKSILCP